MLRSSYFGSPYGSAFLRWRSSRRSSTSLPRRLRLRLRLLPRDRLWRRKALPALILPVPVERNRFTALRFVFSFGIEIAPFSYATAFGLRPSPAKPAPPLCYGLRPPPVAGRAGFSVRERA